MMKRASPLFCIPLPRTHFGQTDSIEFASLSFFPLFSLLFSDSLCQTNFKKLIPTPHNKRKQKEARDKHRNKMPPYYLSAPLVIRLLSYCNLDYATCEVDQSTDQAETAMKVLESEKISEFESTRE